MEVTLVQPAPKKVVQQGIGLAHEIPDRMETPAFGMSIRDIPTSPTITEELDETIQKEPEVILFELLDEEENKKYKILKPNTIFQAFNSFAEQNAEEALKLSVLTSHILNSTFREAVIKICDHIKDNNRNIDWRKINTICMTSETPCNMQTSEKLEKMQQNILDFYNQTVSNSSEQGQNLHRFTLPLNLPPIPEVTEEEERAV